MRQGYDCVEYNKPDAPIPRAEPIPPFMSSLSLILLLLMASVLGVILVRRSLIGDELAAERLVAPLPQWRQKKVKALVESLTA